MVNIERDLKQPMYQKIDIVKGLAAAAESEGRGLTQNENQRKDKLMSEIKDLEGKINQETENQDEQARNATGPANETGKNELRIYKPGEEARFVEDVKKRSGFRYDRLSDDVPYLGHVVRAQITGDYSKLPQELRVGDDVMITTSGSDGGYMVPEPLSAMLIQKALEKMVVRRAGARMVEMDSKTLTIAKLTDMPDAAWVAENAEASVDNPEFDKVDLTAKKLMGLCKLSVELAEDGNNIAQVIEDTLANALALEMDRAALEGSGSGEEPEGVLEVTGVQEMATIEAITDYSDFSDAYVKLLESNESASALIKHPKLFGVLDKLVADNQPVKPPASWERYNKYVTNQVSEANAFMGDFAQMMLGMRTDAKLEISRGGDELMKHGQVLIRCYLRGDIQLARPAAFVKMTGITY